MVIGKAKLRVIVSLCALKEGYRDGDNILASLGGQLAWSTKSLWFSPTPLVQVSQTWKHQQYVPGEDYKQKGNLAGVLVPGAVTTKNKLTQEEKEAKVNLLRPFRSALGSQLSGGSSIFGWGLLKPR